jgi:hypothetical protein
MSGTATLTWRGERGCMAWWRWEGGRVVGGRGIGGRAAERDRWETICLSLSVYGGGMKAEADRGSETDGVGEGRERQDRPKRHRDLDLRGADRGNKVRRE